jgi:hypothetical protein
MTISLLSLNIINLQVNFHNYKWGYSNIKDGSLQSAEQSHMHGNMTLFEFTLPIAHFYYWQAQSNREKKKEKKKNNWISCVLWEMCNTIHGILIMTLDIHKQN